MEEAGLAAVWKGSIFWLKMMAEYGQLIKWTEFVVEESSG